MKKRTSFIMIAILLIGIAILLFYKKDTSVPFFDAYPEKDWRSVTAEYGEDGGKSWVPLTVAPDELKAILKGATLTRRNPPTNNQMPHKFFLIHILSHRGTWVEIVLGDQGELYYAPLEDLSKRQFWSDGSLTAFSQLAERLNV